MREKGEIFTVLFPWFLKKSFENFQLTMKFDLIYVQFLYYCQYMKLEQINPNFEANLKVTKNEFKKFLFVGF